MPKSKCNKTLVYFKPILIITISIHTIKEAEFTDVREGGGRVQIKGQLSLVSGRKKC